MSLRGLLKNENKRRQILKEWVMIHKIKALYDGGKGLSIKGIAKELGISRNTVRKYLRMDEKEIGERLENPSRRKKLDDYEGYIVHLLETYPDLSAVKVLRKLRDKAGGIEVSERSMRRYLQSLKERVICRRKRYYEPVLDMVPGVQCQVDLGEMSGIEIGGEERKIYFVVFVLSYSRLLYVSVSFRPIDTELFIRVHDEAFRYFGGCPEECVYDQTKLVVINEEFRELELNERFHQYATMSGFRIRACEGYDPESKGKVEAGVKYVKRSGLYGESFSEWQDVELYMREWMDNTANVRIHGTTGRKPIEMYEEDERCHMRPYLPPACVNSFEVLTQRKVDKTGLISWCGNKYSVPMRYQGGIVGVEEVGTRLVIKDIFSGKKIAWHRIHHGKGQIIKNKRHYRDKLKRIGDLEAQICDRLGKDLGTSICKLLKVTSPDIYKDQLFGLVKVFSSYPEIDIKVIERLSQAPRLTVTRIRDYLEAYTLSHKETEKDPSINATTNALAKYAVMVGGSHAVN